MGPRETSTLEFRSNVYPVNADMIVHDRAFLGVISDHQALDALYKHSARRGEYLNRLQRKQLKWIAHCSYAPEGDYPWGTVVVGKELRFTCLCTNYSCPYFSECRPDFPIPLDESTEVAESAELSVETAQAAIGLIESPARPTQSPDENIDLPVEQQVAAPCPTQDETGTAEESGKGEFTEKATLPGEVGTSPEALTHKAQLVEYRPEFISSGPAEVANPVAQEAPEVVASTAKPPVRVSGSTYDEQQALIVEANPSARLYVNAGPGTGKTHALIEKLKYMMEVQHVDPSAIVVLSFTRAAVAVVQDRLRAASIAREISGPWQDIDVTTFDKFCTKLLYELADAGRKMRSSIQQMDYDGRINYVATVIKNEPELLSDCCHLIVDETQDLEGPRAKLTLNIIDALPKESGVTLLGDRCQSLYDYLARKGQLDSEQFYDAIRERGSFSELELRHNYRQGSTIAYDLTPMRNCILKRDIQGAGEFLDSITTTLEAPTTPLRNLAPQDFKPSTSSGRLAILTRTNAEVLGISSIMYKLDIDHITSRRRWDAQPSRVIADVFSHYKGNTVDEKDFIDACQQLGMKADDALDLWFELTSLRKVIPEGGRYRIGDLLRAVYEEILPKSLTATEDCGNQVYVGTIHSAKGMEFEDVWLLDNNLRSLGEHQPHDEKNQLDEQKVAYVALSRAMKHTRLQMMEDERLQDSGRQNSYKKCKTEDRCYGVRNRISRTRRPSLNKADRKKLTHVELLNGSLNDRSDLIFQTLCASMELQQRLAQGDLRHAPLILCDYNPDRKTYSIYLQDEPTKIGETSPYFADGFGNCCQEALGEIPSHMPLEFDELYLDQVISCVGPSTKAPECAASFPTSKAGQIFSLWYGFTIGGFAHVDESQGH